MGATTFDKEQLDAMDAISLDEFAMWLADGLTPALAATERIQALLKPKLLDVMHLDALFEAQSSIAPTPTCAEEAWPEDAPTCTRAAPRSPLRCYPGRTLWC